MRLSLSSLQHRVRDALAARSPVMGTGFGSDPTFAAVAVILAPDPDSVLLIRRAERAGDPWSGHMGLPGGRVDPDDADLLATAMRETVEEVGCTLDRERLLGVLDDVWPRSPLQRAIVVRPYVFAVAERPSFTLSGEVDEAFWIPLAELQRPQVYRETIIHLAGEARTFPAYHLEPGVVWGLTERILTPLLELV